MSYKSMESVMNIFNNKPLRSHSRDSIVYSTEVVNDMRKIVKYDAFSREFDDHLAKISDEVDMTINSIESFFYTMERKYVIGMSMKNKFSKEMFDYYARSLEKINVKEVASKVGKTIVEAIKRLISFFVGLYKKFEAFVKRLWIGRYVKTYDEFDPKNFNNMDAKVKVHKLSSNLNVNNFGFENGKFIDKVKDELNRILSIPSQMSVDTKITSKINKDVKSYDDKMSLGDMNEYEKKTIGEIYEKYFGSSEKPKAEEMSVREYLKCQQNVKPKLLELISKSKIEEIKKGQKTFEEAIKKCKDVQKDVEKNLKDDKENNKEGIQVAKNKVTLLKIMSSLCSTEFVCIATVLGDINKAINAGLSSKKKDEKK